MRDTMLNKQPGQKQSTSGHGIRPRSAQNSQDDYNAVYPVHRGLIPSHVRGYKSPDLKAFGLEAVIVMACSTAITRNGAVKRLLRTFVVWQRGVTVITSVDGR